MTEVMPVPRNLSFTVLPAGGLCPSFFSANILSILIANNLSIASDCSVLSYNYFIIYPVT